MANLAVFQDLRSAFSESPHDDIHHRSSQVVGTNHLVGKQQPKCGIEGAQTR